MSVLMPALFGNGRAKTALCNSIKARRLPQAIILEGDDGSGKMTFAREIAAAACCNGREETLPCGSCRSCDRIRRGITPDIVVVRREEKKTTIGVDAVRAMSEQARTGPCELQMLFFIVENADTMTVQAQNSWLLTLENPPEDVGFILLCENARNLLETIRSRAPTFRMQRFEPQKTVEYILANPKRFGVFSDRNALYESAVASNGSIGKTLELSNTDGSALLHEKRLAALNSVRMVTLSRITKAEKAREVYRLPDSREELRERLMMMSLILCDLILLKNDEKAHLSFFTPQMREEAIEMSDSCSISALLGYRSTVDAAAEALLANASVKGIRTDVALRLGLL